MKWIDIGVDNGVGVVYMLLEGFVRLKDRNLST